MYHFYYNYHYFDSLSFFKFITDVFVQTKTDLYKNEKYILVPWEGNIYATCEPYTPFTTGCKVTFAQM